MRFGIDVEPVLVDRGAEFRVEADQVLQVLVLFERFGEGHHHRERFRRDAVVQHHILVLLGHFDGQGLAVAVAEIERQRVTRSLAGGDVADGILVRGAVRGVHPRDVRILQSAYLEVLLHVAALRVIGRDHLADQYVGGHVVALLQPVVAVGEPQFRRGEFEFRDAFELPSGEFRGIDGHLVAGVVFQGRPGDDPQHPHSRKVDVEIDGGRDRYGFPDSVLFRLDVLLERHENRHFDARHSVRRRFDDIGRLPAA